MKISVHWLNATRPKEIRKLVELTYRDAILEIGDGVENVKRAYDYAKAHPRDPFQDWCRFNQYARNTIAPRLSMAETSGARLQITFDQELHHGRKA